MTRRPQRGFTLVEMMIVIAILSVLVALTVITVRPSSKPVDVATRVSNLVQEATRTAVRYGVVSSAVATSEGSKRRTRVRASSTSPLVFTVEVMTESPTVVWTEIDSYQVPTTITATGYAMSVGTYSVLSPTLETDWSTFSLSCYPNGACDGATLFFTAAAGATSDRYARISVLPLGAATYVQRGWD